MARKRKRNLEPRVENNDEQIEVPSISIADLPSAIVVEIVLKLPTKSIVMCKSVCKSWRDLISDPRFAETHLAQAKTCTLFRNVHYLKFWRSLYLLEPEDVCGLDRYCVCISGHGKCNRCRSGTTLTARVMIPVKKPQVMLDKVINSDSMFCIETRSKNQSLIKFKTAYEHRYAVMNSSNGLLCLSNTRFSKISDINPVVVCNPVTGEFTILPELSYGDGFEQFGLGFSPKHNQYKVLRAVTEWRNDHHFLKLAEIHTLGTGAWRNLDVPGVEIGSLWSPSYLDGALYWIFYDKLRYYQVASFDLDEEQFRIHSDPSLPSYFGKLPQCHRDNPHLALRVLGGRLYLFTDLAFYIFDVWVMDINGTSKCWTKLLSIDFMKSRDSHELSHRYELICCLNNEAVVLFCVSRNEFVYYDQLQGMRFKQLKFKSLASDVEAISHTPSFVSLKSIVNQDGVEVSNINSRCGKLKFLEETYPVCLLGGRSRHDL